MCIRDSSNQEALFNNSYNSQQRVLAQENTRGTIYAGTGEVLAQTVIAEDGTSVREYPYKNIFAHVEMCIRDRFNVATAYRTAGKYEEALANYRRALEIYQKELPKDDYRLAELYSSISILLEKLNENENAALFLEKAIQIMEKQPGTRVEVATSRTRCV